MGSAKAHEPVMLIVGAFSRHPESFEWAQSELELRWGPIQGQSQNIPFQHTFYYTEEMGVGLFYKLFSFSRLIDPSSLVSIKIISNQLESEYAAKAVFPEPRPLNLDPGYLTTYKFVLATTKDAAHRIYLNEGIYAESTLQFVSGAWEERDWTYANYREPAYKEFLTESRLNYLKLRRAELGHVQRQV